MPGRMRVLGPQCSVVTGSRERVPGISLLVKLCNKFPTDAVSASNYLYSILKAFDS